MTDVDMTAPGAWTRLKARTFWARATSAYILSHCSYPRPGEQSTKPSGLDAAAPVSMSDHREQYGYGTEYARDFYRLSGGHR